MSSVYAVIGSFIFCALCLCTNQAVAQVQQSQVTHEFSNLVSFRVPSTVAGAVEVRFQNTLPHACTVEVSVTWNGETSLVKVPALPFTWSGWTVVHSSIGGGSYRISYKPMCDAHGLRGQVRYWQEK